jgi:tRNA-dihydrouridine synthase B
MSAPATEIDYSPQGEAAQQVRNRLRELPPLAYRGWVLPSRYALSPLAGYTNLPFRRIVRELGGLGLGTTDLVNARGLIDGSIKTNQLTETCPEDAPFAVQIFGNVRQVMAEAAQLLESRGVPSIDINMGCPVQRITKGGAGASMMCETDNTLGLVQTVVEAVKIPVTVKMRLGWDETKITAPFFAREFEQLGVAAIAIHGRTRAQGFTGTVDRTGIRQVVESVSQIPVIANGDIRNVTDAIRMFAETGCVAISIGRGALANPWIFRQLSEWEQTGQVGPSGTFQDRLRLLRRQFGYVQQQKGAGRAISSFRKMAHWYTKAMFVSAYLRQQLQTASSLAEFEATLDAIAAAGPTRGQIDGSLPEWQIPVPTGPIEHW